MLPMQSDQKTMSTREIADITGKRHADILRDTRKMLKELDLAERNFASSYSDGNGQERPEIKLNQDLSITLVAGYNVKMRFAIVERWKELEQKQSQPQFQIPQTFAEAMQLAADQAKQLEIQAPKIAVYEMLADRKGDVSTTIVAKEIGISAIKLNKFLRENGVKWQKADLPKAGYESWFNVVADVKNGHEYTQCLVTPEGQVGIAKLWGGK